MKLIIQNNRVIGTATDDYSGDDQHMDAPTDFDLSRMSGYVVIGDTLSLAVPTAVSPRQIRQALTRAGLRTSVEAAVAAGDQDLKDWWEFSSPFERVNPQVTAMGAALGVTEQQLDDLWTLASSL